MNLTIRNYLKTAIKIHRRDAESAEGAQRGADIFFSALSLCDPIARVPRRLCGEYLSLGKTLIEPAPVLR